jgi:hypothetical protein
MAPPSGFAFQRAVSFVSYQRNERELGVAKKVTGDHISRNLAISKKVTGDHVARNLATSSTIRLELGQIWRNSAFSFGNRTDLPN